jgi:hypothetical protein
MVQAAPIYYPLTLNENHYVGLRIESVGAFAGADPQYTVAVEFHRLSV